MWLAHHFPDDYDRCVVIAGRHVCRRCAALYPVALAVMVISLAGWHWPESADPWLLWLLPLPSVIEFVGEHAGWLRHRPVRQVVLTIPLAVALGRGFAIYVREPGSLLFWGVVVVYGGICGLAVLLASRRTAEH
jgi:hypothetical protein